MRIAPQKGPQEEFLRSNADIAIYGGSAGAGKSYALLIEPLRHINNPGFGAVFFRRERPQIVSEGGLWDTANILYSKFKGAKSTNLPLKWEFKSKAKVSFSHLQHEKSVKSWDGSQIPLLCFDELQHFSKRQFFYMLSRNRTTCGVKPYVRASCNPDPDSWLREFLSWWIDQDTGYPIPERSGKIRYMVRSSDQIYWGDTVEELVKRFPNSKPKSVTFIMATIHDNPTLLKMNPEYLGNLEALPDYEKKRLLGGNWFIRPSAGELLKRKYFKIINKEDLPELQENTFIRYWDRAGTLPNDTNPDPDWTAGAKMALDYDDNVYILDIVKDRVEPYDVQEMVKYNASLDGYETVVCIEQDPGQAGKAEAQFHVRNLSGFAVETINKNKNKLSYWKPLAVKAKSGQVFIVRGSWNESFLQEAEGVTDGSQPGHDDQVDAVAGGFMFLSNQIGSFGMETCNIF